MPSTPTEQPERMAELPMMKRPAPQTIAPPARPAGASSHNTFRPDIYRVSEGYLN